jgi:hypothetical protein
MNKYIEDFDSDIISNEYDKYYKINMMENVVGDENIQSEMITNIIPEIEAETSIIFIEKNKIKSSDKKIDTFIKFCIRKKLFDNTFYDYNNTFSVFATKLPFLFNKISADNEYVDKDIFIYTFNKLGYNNNIEYIFNQISCDNKKKFTWTQMVNFFIPFVKYITI